MLCRRGRGRCRPAKSETDKQSASTHRLYSPLQKLRPGWGTGWVFSMESPPCLLSNNPLVQSKDIFLLIKAQTLAQIQVYIYVYIYIYLGGGVWGGLFSSFKILGTRVQFPRPIYRTTLVSIQRCPLEIELARIALHGEQKKLETIASISPTHRRSRSTRRAKASYCCGSRSRSCWKWKMAESYSFRPNITSAII